MTSRKHREAGLSKDNGQEKTRLLQKEIARAARRLAEDDRADGRRRTTGGRRSDGRPCRQGGKFLHERVFVWNDEYRPGAIEPNRRGTKAHCRRGIRHLHEL